MFVTTKADSLAPLSADSERFTHGGPDAPSQFPRLSEAAHFHYEEAKLQSCFLTAKLSTNAQPQQHSIISFEIGVFSGHAAWTVKKTLSDIFTLDHQLHVCLLDRSFSNLPALSNALRNCSSLSKDTKHIEAVVEQYFKSLAQLMNSRDIGINCSLVLAWFELDNKGNHLSVVERRNLNIPAIAAAQVVRRHLAESDNELNLIEGDLISLIDMPSPSENSWWRGKKGFKVGYFPSQCVQIIDTRRAAESAAACIATDGGENRSPAGSLSPLSSSSLSPSSGGSTSSKPVLKNNGKVASCLSVLFKERPSRDALRQSGIYKFDRVFGCDLGQYLVNHNQPDGIPLVVRWCVEMIERCGIVDGIYRHSGSNQNIHALREIFDAGRLPNESDAHTHDAHAISCLLKTYFRELPNPLLTHNLYFDFVSASDIKDESESLAELRKLLNRLPPPHHRTLKYLIAHLSRISSRAGSTGMNPKNLSIVWAPNLLRPFLMAPKDCLLYVTRQARVVELLIANHGHLFETANHNKACHDDPPAIAAQPWLLSIDVAQKLYQSKSIPVSSDVMVNSEGSEQDYEPACCVGSPVPLIAPALAMGKMRVSQSHDNLKAIANGAEQHSSASCHTAASKCRSSFKRFANLVRETLPHSAPKQTTKPTIVHCNSKLHEQDTDLPAFQAQSQIGRKPQTVWKTISLPRSKSISSPEDAGMDYVDDSGGAGQVSPLRRWPLASDNSMVWTGNHSAATLGGASSFTALNHLFLNSQNASSNINECQTPPSSNSLITPGKRSTSKVILVRGPTTTINQASNLSDDGSPRLLNSKRHHSADELSTTGLASGSTSVTTLSPLPPSKKDEEIGGGGQLNGATPVNAMLRLYSVPNIRHQHPHQTTPAATEIASNSSGSEGGVIEHATPVLPIDLESASPPPASSNRSSTRQLLMVPLKQQENVVVAKPVEEGPDVKEMRLVFENSGIF